MTEPKPKIFALIIFIIGVFMSALDNGIISSALSTINYAFNVSEVQGTWGVTLYTLGMAISTPIAGKLADRYGRKKLFLIEIAIFALGSLMVALSANFPMFLAARVLQSFGGGGIFIIASSHIISTYPKEKQGGLLGALGAINGIASVVGPNIGSLVLNVSGHWSWLFLINLPIAVFVLIAGTMAIPETKAAHGGNLDFKGLIFLTFGILSFMLAIANIQSQAFLSSLATPQVFIFLILGVIFFIIFSQIEKHIKGKVEPFLPYNLIRNSGFLLTLFMGLLSGTLIAIFVFIPSFVEHRYGISASNSGIWMSGIGLGSIIGAGVGGTLVNKFGATKSLVISGILSTLGFTLITFLSPTTTWFLVSSTLAGIGFGMLMGAPFQVLMSEIAGEKQNGVALGTLSVSRQVGLTLAPTIYATLVQGGFANFVSDKLSHISGTAGIHAGQSVENLYVQIRHLTGTAHTQALAAFQQTAQMAYQNMFFVSIIASVLILIGGFYLYKHNF
ncbi:MFS transporter [Agrilactobacillus fermenti]|uniref:MFS transporter n=1 Tax=Agrilactobacillus fermenti TaxID=2586909 RepID=UPI003A5C2151